MSVAASATAGAPSSIGAAWNRHRRHSGGTSHRGRGETALVLVPSSSSYSILAVFEHDYEDDNQDERVVWLNPAPIVGLSVPAWRQGLS